ncbi:MAG: isoprenylcysteine carboxylmethyltransferase family protein [Anaerolineaceae bacterium]|nr:isoprenylcysteine carboxylmethyltransferase family protein [Anaerolineaceae bacterium]
MSKWIAIIVLWVLTTAQKFIRLPYEKKYKATRSFKVDRYDAQERALLYLLGVGVFILPLLYGLTPWFNFANYLLPWWQFALGIGVILFSYWLFWRCHTALDKNWSPSLQIREDQELIDTGIYRHIRHPMYAVEFLFTIGQLLIIPNWFIGVMGLVCFLPLYLIRVPKEEAMMIETFGNQYRDYMQRTGRILPRLSKKK